MDEPELPRTLAQFPYVTVRVACPHCPARRGVYRLARLAARFGPDMPLPVLLYLLSRSCRWQVPPETRRRKYVWYCRAYFVDLAGAAPADEPPPDSPEPPVAGRPRLRVVGGREA